MANNSSSSSSSSSSKCFSKQYSASASSSSSSIAELFGPKDSLPSATSYSHSPSSDGSSPSIFGSVFGPSSMGGVRDSTSQGGNFKNNVPGNWPQNSRGESGKSSYYQQETLINLATSALQSTMVAKKFILLLLAPTTLVQLLRKMSKMTIQTVLQEEIGGKGRFIISLGGFPS